MKNYFLFIYLHKARRRQERVRTTRFNFDSSQANTPTSSTLKHIKHKARHTRRRGLPPLTETRTQSDMQHPPTAKPLPTGTDTQGGRRLSLSLVFDLRRRPSSNSNNMRQVDEKQTLSLRAHSPSTVLKWVEGDVDQCTSRCSAQHPPPTRHARPAAVDSNRQPRTTDLKHKCATPYKSEHSSPSPPPPLPQNRVLLDL